MKTTKEIQAKIEEICNDDRYPKTRKECATVDVNAPLALIQVSMKAKVAALKWVIENRENNE